MVGDTSLNGSKPLIEGSENFRSCLFIDMAYSLEEVRRRQHFQFVEARHSGTYFQKVVALHPLADLVIDLQSPIERKRYSDRQDIIEAKSAALKLPSWLRPLNVFLTQRRLLKHITKIVRDENISVIAATGPDYAGLFAYWLKRRTGVPTVLHLVTSYDLVKNLSFAKKAMIRFTLRRADLVAAGSKTLREYAVGLGVRPDHATVFKVGKNVDAVHRVPPHLRQKLTPAERDQLGISATSKLLLTVARLEPVKWVEDSIRAFTVVQKVHPDAVLLLAGDGSERNRLESLVHELGVAEKVRFLGLVDQEFLSRLEPECLTLSPLTGMALFETSLAASPAVAYDCDSVVTELVETDVTGALIAPRDWEGMGLAASRILGSQELFRQFGGAIRERAVSLTSFEILYAHEHAEFDRLLDRTNDH